MHFSLDVESPGLSDGDEDSVHSDEDGGNGNVRYFTSVCLMYPRTSGLKAEPSTKKEKGNTVIIWKETYLHMQVYHAGVSCFWLRCRDVYRLTVRHSVYVETNKK